MAHFYHSLFCFELDPRRLVAIDNRGFSCFLMDKSGLQDDDLVKKCLSAFQVPRF